MNRILPPRLLQAVSLAVMAVLAAPIAVAQQAGDTTPPAAPDQYRISIQILTSYAAAVTALPGAAEPLSTVRIRNERSGATRAVAAGVDGSFSTPADAQSGDRLVFTAADAAGNVSSATTMAVAAFRIKNPYQPIGYWHTGQTHTHTNASDGYDSPRDLEAAYFDSGYHFIISTDHRGPLPHYTGTINGMTPDPSNSDRGKDLLWIRSAEIGTPTAHLGAWGTVSQVELSYLNSNQSAVNRIRELGGIVAVNHPRNNDPSKAWDWHDEILATTGYSVVEAFNANPLEEGLGVEHLTMAVDMADAFQQVWWIGADDCHNFSTPGACNRYATVVQSPSALPETADLLAAMDAGAIYVRESGTGPGIVGVEVSGNTVTVRMADVASNYDVTWRKRGNAVAQSSLDVDTQSSYTVNGSEGYVRAEIVRKSDGKRAWTQPLFVGNSTDLATGASHASLVDNNRSTTWDAGAPAGSFVVDAGSLRQLNGIAIDWHDAGSSFNYYLETSPTGLFAGEQKLVMRRSWRNAAVYTLDFFDEYSRYVRVVITGVAAGSTGNARVREVELFDSSPAINQLYIDNVAGNDANAGNSSSPWRTWDHAKELIRPREKLNFVATGTPYPPLMWVGPRQSGKHPGAIIQFSGDPFKLTPVDAAGAAHAVFFENSKYTEWSHFDMYGALTAPVIVRDTQSGTVIRANRIHGSAARGVRGAGQFTLAQNLIYGNATEGVFVYVSGTDFNLYNNVIYGNGTWGVDLHTTGHIVADVRNNITDANVNGAMRKGTNSVVTGSHHCGKGAFSGIWPSAGNVNAEPGFTGAGIGDFQLQGTSPCIDAGIDLDFVADFAGNPIADMPVVPNTGSAGQYTRTWADMGAYEQQPPCCTSGGGCHR